MKLKVSQTEFSRALVACEASLPSKATLPILVNLLLSASKDRLEILSTNLETATKVTVPSRVEREGKVALPGRVLTELVPQLSEGEITLEKLGEEMQILAKGNDSRLATMNPEEFPAIPQIEKGERIKIDAWRFAAAVTKVGFCAAQDESRPILSGVLLEIDKQRLSMVATDGYRLSFVAQKIDGGTANLKLVVPAKAIGEVAKIIGALDWGQDTPSLTIIIADSLNQANFKIGDDLEFTSRLIEGEFPNWQKIIPTKFATRMKIAKAIFAKQVRIASIFARDSGNIIRLKLEGKKLITMANTSQVGSNETTVEAAEVTGRGGEIAFNYRYLLEALSAIEEEEVSFEMIESLSPGRLSGANGQDDFFHIIMPVRLQS